MKGKKQIIILALIAYGLIATVLIFHFFNYENGNGSNSFKDTLDIMVRANEAQCFDIFIENSGPHVLKNDILKQRKIGELVKCLQKNYLKIQNLIAKESELNDNPFNLNILPVYSVDTYTHPVEVDWFDYDNYDDYKSTMTDNATFSVWAKTFDSDDHKRLMRLFRIITELFSKHKMEFFLTEGSLIGSVRHFDQIPWDDDADILINSKHVDTFLSVVKNQTTFPDLKWVMNNKLKYKVYLESGHQAGRYKWTYPFIDVFFYQENQTHIYRKFRNVQVYTLKSDVFPLKLRPLGKYWLPTARNTMNYLKRLNYTGLHDTCIRGGWNHRAETRQKAYKANCSLLRDHYPFTSINCLPDTPINVCTEVLELKGKGFVYLFYNGSQPITLKINS